VAKRRKGEKERGRNGEGERCRFLKLN